MGFFQGTQERVRNSRGIRATSVRATEGLRYRRKYLVYSNKGHTHKVEPSIIRRLTIKYTICLG